MNYQTVRVNDFLNIGDLVTFKTDCELNGCSGQIFGFSYADSFNTYVNVILPDNKTRLAFLQSELIKH